MTSRVRIATLMFILGLVLPPPAQDASRRSSSEGRAAQQPRGAGLPAALTRTFSVDAAINDNFALSLVDGGADPGEAARRVSRATAHVAFGMLYLAYTY